MAEWSRLFFTEDPRMLAVQLVLAFLLDLNFGEMPRKVHPVVYMGRIIRLFRDQGLKRTKRPLTQFLWGLGMASLIPLLFIALAVGILTLAEKLGPVAECLAGVFLLKSAFAVKALKEAALEVQGALLEGDLDRSRYALRSLCSRDASSLASPDMTSAVIGSLAENLSDSIIAPIFFFVIFGVPGAIGYRVVNTMDAIIGYRDRYEFLGKAAARLDDLLNLIPARLTAFLILWGGALQGFAVRHGLTILQRDRGKTPSPNGGWPMSTMAGVLRVEVNKIGVYSLGDPILPLSATMIDEAWRVAQHATWIWVILSTLILVALPSMV